LTSKISPIIYTVANNALTDLGDLGGVTGNWKEYFTSDWSDFSVSCTITAVGGAKFLQFPPHAAIGSLGTASVPLVSA
jgi:hypothetical protein